MREENSTKKQQKELAEELFKVKKFLENLGVSSFFLKNERVVKILTNKEIIDTIKKYEENVAKRIAYWITIVAYYLGNENAIIEMARTIGKYEGYAAKGIANRIAWAAYELREIACFS